MGGIGHFHEPPRESKVLDGLLDTRIWNCGSDFPSMRRVHSWYYNGGEYRSSDFDQFCDEICVKRSYTVPYNSWQNPYAERAWGTVLRKVRTSLVDSGLSDKYWSYAIKHAAVVHNVLCDEECKSPYEIVHRKDFDYLSLHVLFCTCYYLLPDRNVENKVSPRALPAIYLGIDTERNGHLVEVPGLENRVTTGHHVVFNACGCLARKRIVR